MHAHAGIIDIIKSSNAHKFIKLFFIEFYKKISFLNRPVSMRLRKIRFREIMFQRFHDFAKSWNLTFEPDLAFAKTLILRNIYYFSDTYQILPFNTQRMLQRIKSPCIIISLFIT